MRPAALLALAQALATPSVYAQAPRVAIELTYTQGPAASCLDEQGFKREVIERVGCDPPAGGRPTRRGAAARVCSGSFEGCDRAGQGRRSIPESSAEVAGRCDVRTRPFGSGSGKSSLTGGKTGITAFRGGTMKDISYRLSSLAVLVLACASIGADGCFGNPFDKNAWSGVTTSGAGANDGCGTLQGQGGGYGGAPGAGGADVGAGAGVSGVDAAAGAGGGDPGYSPQTSSSCDGEEQGTYIRCWGMGPTACAARCNAIGAYCVELATHPTNPSIGIGNLKQCMEGLATYVHVLLLQRRCLLLHLRA
jgi:hypothetical protein